MTSSLVTTDVARAASALAAGGLVAMPTETVYGLAASARSAEAIARIFAAKGRPADHPLIVHLADAADMDDWIDAPAPAAQQLAAHAWPGPLTIIGALRSGATLTDREARRAVTGGRDTVGVRVPAHPMARQLISLSGTPVAAPSANRFGRVSPTTAQHVLDDLGPYLDPQRDLILDGGPCDVGVESTIVDCATDPPQILRSGGIPDEHIAELLEGTTTIVPAAGPSRASGMLASHYAPRCPVLLVADIDAARSVASEYGSSAIIDLSNDLPRYAKELYARLRSADESGAEAIVAVLPEPHGLGHAVRDRLNKAAAPRPA